MVTGVGEPKDGGNSVLNCSTGVRMVLFSGKEDGSEMNPMELPLNGVGRDAGAVALFIVTGEKTETAGVAAGVLSLDVSTRGPEPSSE